MKKPPKFIPSKDKEEYNIDYDTSNKSFLDVSAQLENYGIQNKTFMLRLYDQSLVHVDPYYVQDNKTKSKIIRECERNIWYFFREVVRIPALGGGSTPFKLDLTSCAQIYLFERNISSWVTKSRFLYKTTTCQSLCNYNSIFPLLSDRKYDESIEEYTIDRSNRLRHMKMLFECLPEYMRFKNIFTTVIATTKVGSNMKSRTYNFQDKPSLIYFCDAEYIGDIYEIYCNISTITDNDSVIISESTVCDEGDAERVLQHSIQWENKYYDLQDYMLYDLFLNYDNKKEIDGEDVRLFYINFSYSDLGYDELWYEDCIAMLNNDYEAIRREILCRRKK